MLVKCKCEMDSPSIAFDQDFRIYEQSALQTYNVYTQKLQKTQSKNKHIIQAQSIIHDWINADISKQSKNLLNNAARLVKKGNLGIASKINKIGAQLGSSQQSLFQFTQEDIDHIISLELSALGEKNAKTHGEPYIYASVYKN